MDPITLLAAASTAFNGVKKLIEHGREIEDVFSQLGKWATATSDLQEWCKQQDATPSIFKKLSFKNDTAAAMDAVTVRMKLAQQEKDIREMFQWYGPPDSYEEFIRERRKIKAQREKMIYQQARRRKEFMWFCINTAAIVLAIAFVGWLGWLFYWLIATNGS
jgi:hypothetical protein